MAFQIATSQTHQTSVRHPRPSSKKKGQRRRMDKEKRDKSPRNKHLAPATPFLFSRLFDLSWMLDADSERGEVVTRSLHD
jgi:hypothetical protein